MSLPPPSANIRTRYIRLLAMAERGTIHEREVAATKLASLATRYDFSGTAALPTDEIEQDLFWRKGGVAPAKKSQLLIVIDVKDCRVANFVKCVLYEAFQIEGTWRATAKGGETALYVGARNEDLPHLRHIAKVITEAFAALWKRFTETTGGEINDEPAFYEGLYDGMMRNARIPGRAIPSRNRKQKKKGGRKSATKNAQIVPSAVRPHAYSIALELGAQIRLSRSLHEITTTLNALLAPQAV